MRNICKYFQAGSFVRISRFYLKPKSNEIYAPQQQPKRIGLCFMMFDIHTSFSLWFISLIIVIHKPQIKTIHFLYLFILIFEYCWLTAKLQSFCWGVFWISARPVTIFASSNKWNHNEVVFAFFGELFNFVWFIYIFRSILNVYTT